MTKFRLCGTAIAALMISSLPALSQDNTAVGDNFANPPPQEFEDGMMYTMGDAEDAGDQAGRGRFVATVDMDDMADDMLIALPIELAGELCDGLDTDDIAQDIQDGVQNQSCTISEDDARQIGVTSEDGADGQDGQDGRNGRDGEDGEDGRDGSDGEDGEDGADGRDGDSGDDGGNGGDGGSGGTGGGGNGGNGGNGGDGGDGGDGKN